MIGIIPFTGLCLITIFLAIRMRYMTIEIEKLKEKFEKQSSN